MCADMSGYEKAKWSISNYATGKQSTTDTNQQLYFINPHYETKFGFTPRKLNKHIAHIPYLRNFVSISCFYILRKQF